VSWLSTLLGKFGSGIAIVLALIVSVLGIRKMGKAAGRAEAQREQELQNQAAREVRDDVMAEMDMLDDDGVSDRLRRDWVRGKQDGKLL
jgi:hypothetical protein